MNTEDIIAKKISKLKNEDQLMFDIHDLTNNLEPALEKQPIKVEMSDDSKNMTASQYETEEQSDHLHNDQAPHHQEYRPGDSEDISYYIRENERLQKSNELWQRAFARLVGEIEELREKNERLSGKIHNSIPTLDFHYFYPLNSLIFHP